MKAMTDDDLKLLHFVMRDEVEQWKRVEFAYDNVAAVRADGTIVMFTGVNDATEFIRARAMEAALQHYHQEMAKQERPA